MRRKAVHLFAAIAESLRFIAVAFLAFSVGALSGSSVSSLLRYAAAPQLLFAAGFFFMWLDAGRYASYRPLLLVGKIASVACFIPLAAALVRDPGAAMIGFGMAAVDIMSLSILTLVKQGSDMGLPQGRDEIERVEV
jgi:hypothetical protein